MTEEKTCYNCGNKNCNVYYSIVKKDYKRHFEIYEYKDFDCVNHNKWEELKMEEIHTDNTKTLQNALERIKELEKENAELKEKLKPENCLKLLAKDGYVKFTSDKLIDEWHYPSKGEYPKEYKDILICFLTEDDMKDCVRGWYEYDLDENEHYFKTVNTFETAVIKNVIAWKEIVLPELKENVKK